MPFHFARLDLNNPAQRSTVAFVLSFVVIFSLISAVGSYKAYEFTDSVNFCGQLCHTVMHPEFTAYEASPHARVACVDCHVGSGASWYVKSKLSGMRQVYYTDSRHLSPSHPHAGGRTCVRRSKPASNATGPRSSGARSLRPSPITATMSRTRRA